MNYYLLIRGSDKSPVVSGIACNKKTIEQMKAACEKDGVRVFPMTETHFQKIHEEVKSCNIDSGVVVVNE